MTGTARGNMTAWFASDEERALARRWAISSGIATFFVWWFQLQSRGLLAIVLLYQILLAVRSYSVTGRRWFLVLPALPLAPALVWWKLPVEESVTALVVVVLVVAAAVLWPLVGLTSLAVLVRPGRAAPRAWAMSGATVFLGLTAYVDSLTGFAARVDAEALTPASVAGCYRLRSAISFPPMRGSVPNMVRFDTTHWSAVDTTPGARGLMWSHRRLVPAMGPSAGYWKDPKGGRVFVGWTTRGLVGVAGELRRSGDDLVGRLEEYVDMPGPIPLPVASVRFQRVSCASSSETNPLSVSSRAGSRAAPPPLRRTRESHDALGA